MAVICSISRPGKPPLAYDFLSVPRVGDLITFPGDYQHSYVVDLIHHFAGDLDDAKVNGEPTIQVHVKVAKNANRARKMPTGLNGTPVGLTALGEVDT